MARSSASLITALLAISVPLWAQSPPPAPRPIVVQGAMPVETERLASRLDGTAVEEMETAAAAQIAGLLGVRFVGIRIVSDNITNGEPYDRKTGEACQDFVYQVVKAFIPTLKR